MAVEVEDETPVFGRIVSAPMAPGAEAGSGYCSKPGHGNFELSMFCQDCNEKYCLRCTGDHVGHATGDTASGKGLIQRSSSIPSKSESRSEFDDQMARFRRTTSASSLAAARAIALVGKLQRSMTVALKSTESTLKSAKSILEEAGQAIAKWFKGLSGQALDSAILKAFQQFDANGSGLLDREEFAKAMYAMGLRLSEQELDMLFKEFDVDGSGTIDIKEFQQMVKRYLCSNEEQAFVLSEERAREMKQKWVDDPSRWRPSAALLQSRLRAVFAQQKLKDWNRHATSIQTQARSMFGRNKVRRMKITIAQDGRFTELNLTTEELLASIPILCKIPQHLRRNLVKKLAWHKFFPNDQIVQEGEPADSMFILIDGTAKVLRGPGKTEVMDFKAGNFFGENSLTEENLTRHASVIATATTTCIEITRDVWKEFDPGPSLDVDEIITSSFNAVADEEMKEPEEDPHYMQQQNREPSVDVLVRLPSAARRHQEAIRLSQSSLNGNIEPDVPAPMSARVSFNPAFESTSDDFDDMFSRTKSCPQHDERQYEARLKLPPLEDGNHRSFLGLKANPRLARMHARSVDTTFMSSLGPRSVYKPRQPMSSKPAQPTNSRKTGGNQSLPSSLKPLKPAWAMNLGDADKDLWKKANHLMDEMQSANADAGAGDSRSAQAPRSSGHSTFPDAAMPFSRVSSLPMSSLSSRTQTFLQSKVVVIDNESGAARPNRIPSSAITSSGVIPRPSSGVPVRPSSGVFPRTSSGGSVRPSFPRTSSAGTRRKHFLVEQIDLRD